MIYLELLLAYIRVGFSSFGGQSMIPLVRAEMLAHGWLTSSELTDIVAIAEMTPGSFGINCATFVGLRTAGVPGAVIASIGAMFPSLTLTMVAAYFLAAFKESPLLERGLYGIRAVCLGMIVAVIFSLASDSYLIAGAISIPAVLIGLLGLYLTVRRQMSIAKVIGTSALLGLFIA